MMEALSAFINKEPRITRPYVDVHGEVILVYTLVDPLIIPGVLTSLCH